MSMIRGIITDEIMKALAPYLEVLNELRDFANVNTKANAEPDIEPIKKVRRGRPPKAKVAKVEAKAKRQYKSRKAKQPVGVKVDVKDLSFEEPELDTEPGANPEPNMSAILSENSALENTVEA